MRNYNKIQALLYAEVEMLVYVSHRDRREAKQNMSLVVAAGIKTLSGGGHLKFPRWEFVLRFATINQLDFY